MAKDTSEEDLTSFLTGVGLKDVRCKLMVPKEGHTFYTAAFRVSCHLEDKAKLLDGASWPIGVEVREWFFRVR